MNNIMEFLKSVPFRIKSNPNTTIGGGAAGVALAAAIGYIEQKSGCKFEAAFGNIDWLQLAGYVFMQVNGALSTDATKTVGISKTE